MNFSYRQYLIQNGANIIGLNKEKFLNSYEVPSYEGFRKPLQDPRISTPSGTWTQPLTAYGHQFSDLKSKFLLEREIQARGAQKVRFTK